MTCPVLQRREFPTIGIWFFYFAVILTSARLISAQPIRVPAGEASIKPPSIVIGFVGGFIAHDNPVHSEVQLAARLRKEYPVGVTVETYESYRGEKARLDILQILDANHDGNLTTEEKQNARIVIYGHSWGAAESIYLARALEKDGIPVLLTIQVDSIAGPRKDDTTIPANVGQAANFYQARGLLQGHHDIHAADPARTRIVGNYQFDYGKSDLKCSEYPWYDRLLVKSHTQIECDPVIWNQIELLIRTNLPSPPPSEPAQPQGIR